MLSIAIYDSQGEIFLGGVTLDQFHRMKEELARWTGVEIDEEERRPSRKRGQFRQQTLQCL